MRGVTALLCVSLLISTGTSYAQETDISVGDVVSNEIISIAGDALSVQESTVEGEYRTEGVPGGETVVGDFVVGPGKVDLTIRPGESKTVTMTVTNRTGERRAFAITTEDAMGSYDTSVPVVLLGSDRGPYSLKDYVQYAHPRFELNHNERALIPVTISIPADAEPGGHYGSVLVETVSIESEGERTEDTVPQSAVVARIGTLFFITVPGDTLHDGEVTRFSTLDDRAFFGSGPIAFGILFRNNGSIHLAPYGEVRITNLFGQEVDFVTLEPWFVLPQSERLREITWNRELLIGRYTATLYLNRSYGDVIDTKYVTFWVLPWKLLGIAFASVFVVVFLIRLFFRSFEFKRKQSS